MTFELIGQPRIESEYSDEWETTLAIELKRDDGQTGEAWVVAGVPPHLQGSSQASGHRYGFEEVRHADFGSWDAWCSFDRPEDDEEAHDMASEIVSACESAAMKAHGARIRQLRAVSV